MLNEKKKNCIKIILIIFFMSISIITLTYSFILVGKKDKNAIPEYFAISEINFGLESEVDSVTLGEALPTLDKFGILNESFIFNVTNTSDESKDFVIKLVDGKNVSTISNQEIRYQLTINDEIVGIYTLDNNGVIDTGILESKEIRKYAIKIWLYYNSNLTSGVWDKVVFIDEGNNNLDTSGANKPVLASSMIPVYYDVTSETWRKADSDNTDKNHLWYNYDSLIWANAITVKEENRLTYLNALPGTEVKMEDINSFWVWIPRYKYTIFNSEFKSTKPSQIMISFEKGTEKTGSITCKSQFNDKKNTSQVCVDDVNGKIKNGVSTYTHPAFTFLDKELPGIWVAKFEAGTDNESMCSESASVKNCDNDQLEIYIKPNIKSLGNITMANLQTNFRKMGLYNNIYGFTGGDQLNNDLTISGINEVDIHMIKNSEWGAVSYLYHSKYGKYGNSDYDGNKKLIYSNNSLLTGNSSGTHTSKGDSYSYDVKEVGQGSSTTGNIYGVYDMVGGKGEMVMVNFQTSYQIFEPNENTGFTSPINNKYYDLYYNNNNITVTNLGDGLKEIKWYNSVMNISSNNVLYRGGSSVSDDGIFGINAISGKTSANIGSRPVLVLN